MPRTMTTEERKKLAAAQLARYRLNILDPIWKEKERIRLNLYARRPEVRARRNEAQRNKYAADPLKEKVRQIARRGTPSRIRTRLKNSANRRGIYFNLDKAAIAALIFEKDVCPICLEKMVPATRTAMSFDRNDNDVGYEIGNVSVICLNCNWIKNNASSWLHRRIADYMDGALHHG